MFLLFFCICHNCCYKSLDGDTVVSILLYTAITATRMLKSDSIGRKSKRTLLVLKIFCYFCNGSRFCVLNWVYSMLISRQPTPS